MLFHQDHVVPVNHFVEPVGSKNPGDIISPVSPDQADIPAGIDNQPPRDQPLVESFDFHGIAGFEVAFDVFDADGKQALAVLLQGASGSVINQQNSFRFVKKSDPAFAGVKSILGIARGGRDQRARVFARQDLLENTRFAAVGNDYGCSGFRRRAGGFQLAEHSPRGKGAFFS